jgi:hypothetical protein
MPLDVDRPGLHVSDEVRAGVDRERLPVDVNGSFHAPADHQVLMRDDFSLDDDR